MSGPDLLDQMVGSVEKAGEGVRWLRRLLLPRAARDLPLLPSAEHTMLIALAALVGLYAAFAATLLRAVVHILDGARHLDDVFALFAADSPIRSVLAPRVAHLGYGELLPIGLVALAAGVGYGLWRDLRRRRATGKLRLRSRGYQIGALCLLAALLHPTLRFLLALGEVLSGNESGEGLWAMVVVAGLGGLGAGYLSRFAKGEESGVPRIMRGVALEGGALPAKEGLGFASGAALTVASYGSVGLEGPVVVFGATTASSLGKALNLSRSRLRVLAAAGAAAGIAAAFNAPIAGALFALEIIVGDFALATFSPVVIASVIGAVVHRSLEGNHPVLSGVAFKLVNGWEILLYVGLGLVSGLVGAVLVRALEAGDGHAQRVFGRLPRLLRPAVGLVVLSALAHLLGLEDMVGSGYRAMASVLHGDLVFGAIALLLVGKILATTYTLAVGGFGGVMFPSLLIGACTGSLFGSAVGSVLGERIAAPSAYAVVGMGAVLTAVQHAPLTAIVLVFEFTNDYTVILPMMVAAILATLLSTRALGGSLYQRVLRRQGIVLSRGREQNVLRSLHVDEVMKSTFTCVPARMHLGELAQQVAASHQTTYPVVDDDGRLVRVLGIHDLKDVMLEKDLADVVVAGELGTGRVATIRARDSLQAAMEAFALAPFEHLIVVAEDDEKRPVGLLSLHDVIAYYQEQLRRAGIVENEIAEPRTPG